MSDVISNFRFEGYKVDRIKYETIPDLQFLKTTGTLAPEGWIFEIAMRQPLFLKKEKKYVGGMEMIIKYPLSKEMLDELHKLSDKKEGTSLESIKDIVKLEIGIAGIFSVEEGRFDKNTEENLVKIQIPMLLFPYLRSTVTSIFAHGGLGSFLFPLINVQELAKKASLQIQEI